MGPFKVAVVSAMSTEANCKTMATPSLYSTHQLLQIAVQTLKHAVRRTDLSVDPRNSALRHNRAIINEHFTVIYKTKIMHELKTFKKVWSYTIPTCLSSGSSLRNGANSPKDVGVGPDHTCLNVCNLFIMLVL